MLTKKKRLNRQYIKYRSDCEISGFISMAKARRAVRCVAVLSLVASIISITASAWTLASILYQHMPEDDGSENVLKNKTSVLGNFGDITHAERSSLWIKFDYMTNNFKAMVVGCTWLVIIFGMMQFCSSTPLVLGSSKVLMIFPKYAIGINFICVIFMIGCISAPLTYNRNCNDSDQDDICSKALSISQLKGKFMDALAHLPPNALQFFWNDLTSYYIFVGLDIVILIFYVVFLMCAVRFGDEYGW